MVLTSVIDPLTLSQMDDKKIRLIMASMQQQILQNQELRQQLLKTTEAFRK